VAVEVQRVGCEAGEVSKYSAPSARKTQWFDAEAEQPCRVTEAEVADITCAGITTSAHESWACPVAATAQCGHVGYAGCAVRRRRVQRSFKLLLRRLRRFPDCLVGRFGHLRCGFRCGSDVTLSDLDGLLRCLLHAFLSGVGQRDSLFQKCDCGFRADRDVLREILDERLNLAAELLVP